MELPGSALAEDGRSDERGAQLLVEVASRVGVFEEMN
jgi:hypothetical protein